MRHTRIGDPKQCEKEAGKSLSTRQNSAVDTNGQFWQPIEDLSTPVDTFAVPCCTSTSTSTINESSGTGNTQKEPAPLTGMNHPLWVDTGWPTLAALNLCCRPGLLLLLLRYHVGVSTDEGGRTCIGYPIGRPRPS